MDAWIKEALDGACCAVGASRPPSAELRRRLAGGPVHLRLRTRTDTGWRSIPVRPLPR